MQNHILINVPQQYQFNIINKIYLSNNSNLEEILMFLTINSAANSRGHHHVSINRSLQFTISASIKQQTFTCLSYCQIILQPIKQFYIQTNQLGTHIGQKYTIQSLSNLNCFQNNETLLIMNPTFRSAQQLSTNLTFQNKLGTIKPKKYIPKNTRKNKPNNSNSSHKSAQAEDKPQYISRKSGPLLDFCRFNII